MIARIESRSDGRSWILLEAEFPGVSAPSLFTWFSQPSLLSNWWAPQATIEPWAGGRYHLCWPDRDWRMSGRVTSWSEGIALGFTWQWDHEPEVRTTEVHMALEQGVDRTKLTLHHGPYDPREVNKALPEQHIEGWLHFLSRLEAALQETKGDAPCTAG